MHISGLRGGFLISLLSFLKVLKFEFQIAFFKKNFVFLLSVLLPNVLTPTPAQSIDFGIGVGVNIHNDNHNQVSPTEDPIVPSIGSFFNNDIGFNSVIQLCLFDNSLTPLLHIEYDRDILSTNADKPFLLGDKITVNSIDFSLGIGFLIPDSVLSLLIFPSLGYVAKFYEGNSDLGANSNMIVSYESGGAIRIGTGAKMILTSLPISILVRSTYDFGTVTRGKIKVYENDNYLGEMTPTGDKTLPDKVLSFQLTLAYHLNF